MASLAEIQQIVQRIHDDLPALINRVQVLPRQVIVTTGLSDISERLGVIQAGEFRSGNAKDPGFGFSGTRMGYPPFTYNGSLWNLVGVNNDVLQFGLNAANGKAYFAAGAAVLDITGMALQAQENQSYFINWQTDDDATTVGKIGAFYVGTDSGIEVVGQTKTGFTPVAHLMTADGSGGFLTGIEVRGNGEIQMDLRTATVDTLGNQKVRIMSNINNTNGANTVLYLESLSKGTAAAGFGTAAAFLAENAAGALKTVGYLSSVYIDPASGSEDTKMMMGYLSGGNTIETPLPLGVKQQTIADDAVYSFMPPSSGGFLMLGVYTTAGNTSWGIYSYRTVATTHMMTMVAGSNIAVTTGVLTGTTGADGNVTVSAHSDGKIYVENRLGASKALNITVI